MRHACERKLRCAGVGAGGWSGATYACVTAERRACLIVPIIGAMRREERHGTQGMSWQPRQQPSMVCRPRHGSGWVTPMLTGLHGCSCTGMCVITPRPRRALLPQLVGGRAPLG